MPLTTTRLAQLGDVLNRILGLEFSAARQADLERSLIAVQRDFGFENVEACLDWMQTATLTRPAIEFLAGHFTVGETHFFREPEIFDILAREILPELINRRRGNDRRLRFWSAGCSSGEEAYSLGIILARLLPDVGHWHVTVLGTDINPYALRKAETGIYDDWSFRVAPGWVKDEYFEHINGEDYEIADSVRRIVSFTYLNLAEDSYPALLTNTSAMDLIFCRNVLLYFSRDQAQAVNARFHRCLNEGGYLIGGSAEHFIPQGFAHAYGSARPIFRKETSAYPSGAAAAVELDKVAPPDPHVSDQLARVPPLEQKPLICPTVAANREKARDLAVTLANDGRLEEALRHCDEAIGEDKLSPEHHYLRATILVELEEFSKAEDALRKTLYLEPGFILAHIGMANVARRLGRGSQGRKYLENAVQLLAETDPEAAIPGSGGITARHISEMVNSMKIQTA